MMTKPEIIQKILSSSQSQGTDVLNAANGVGWMGQPSGVQQQVSESLLMWIEHDDSQPLIGTIALMQTLDLLTATEAETLLASIAYHK